MSDKDLQESEIKSKEWSEIIAEQFSVVAWIKGLKIYLTIIGVLGAWAYLSSDNFACGTIGIICFIIAYSLNANKSKEIDVNLDSENTNDDDEDTSDNNTTDIDEEIKLKETDDVLLKENLELKKKLEAKTEEIEVKTKGSGGAWAGSIGALILVIAWGTLLLGTIWSDYTEDGSNETYWCQAMTPCAITEFILPALILVTVPLTGLVYWQKERFFPNTNAKMYARDVIRLTYAFIYFLIFFAILASYFGWYAPDLTLIDVMIMATFFLASSFISVLPKYTPTKEDSKDAEFMTFFIIFTILNYTFFMMLSVVFYTNDNLTIFPIIFFCILILLILSYNFILEFVKKYILGGQNNVDDTYDVYKKEKNTGSLLYIGLISFLLFTSFTTFILSLLVSLFVISKVKTRITGFSDWKTPLGDLTKYEFALFTFNIVIVLAVVYAIHDEIEFSRSENEAFSNSCESLKAGEGVVRWGYWDGYAYIQDCDLSYKDLRNEYMRDSEISDTSFNFAILRGADLSNVGLSGDIDFTNADLYGADLSNADCYDYCTVNFSNAKLRNVDFSGAYLPNANFQSADLRGADFTEATFTHAVFAYSTIDKDALAGIRLDNSDFTNFDLYGYDLTGTSLEGVDFSGRDFSGYDFTGANFNGANLSGTNLSGSTLTGISGFDLQGCPLSMPDNWICLENNLIGPETTFKGLDFSNANLSNIDLSNSNFSSATLKNTSFSNTNLSNTYFSYRNFDEINDMIMWYEDDPENVTDFFGHIDFEGDFDDYLVKIKTESAADLSNANLSGANLSYVNFAYVNLTNADLSDADLTGTIWRYTICPDGTNTEESGSCTI